MQKRVDPKLIRRYLLGDLDEVQLEQVEERLLTDEQLQSELSDAQDSLVDDYVLGVLTQDERRLFEKNFLLTPERLHKLRLAHALVSYADADAVAASTLETKAGSPSSLRQKLARFFQERKFVVVVAAAALLLLATYVGWNVYRNRQLQNSLSQARNQRLKVEQELVGLNAGQLPAQASILAATLKLSIVRDAGDMRRVIVNKGTDILQLRLELDSAADESAVYKAVIETDEEVELYAINDLKAKSGGEGKVVVLNFPGHLLRTGNYQVRLRKITPTGSTMDVGIYPFQVILK